MREKEDIKGVSIHNVYLREQTNSETVAFWNLFPLYWTFVSERANAQQTRFP